MTSASAEDPLGAPGAGTPETGDLKRRLADAERRAFLAEERAATAESEAGRLRRDLDIVMAEIEAADREQDSSGSVDQPSAELDVFSASRPVVSGPNRPTLSADGSDVGLLPLAFGGTAGVAGLALIVIAINGALFSPIGLIMLALAIGLGFAAVAYRVDQVEVTVSKGGIVYVNRSRENSLRFDLSDEKTRVAMHGHPSTDGWSLTISGRWDEFTITPDVVEDPGAFTERVRAFKALA